jgi:penicillin-binding protein 1A
MPSEPDRARARRRLARRLFWWVRALVALLCLGVALGLGALALLIAHYEAKVPAVTELRDHRPPQTSRVLARDGTVLGEMWSERRTVVPIAEVPSAMKLAILAAEDASFYQHTGINYFGIARAVFVNLRRGGAAQGGSTITQQLVKNVLLSPERTFDRKMREVLLARKIEQELTKDQILELYLNQIYFGHGRYGVEEAARYYFGKSVREVSLGEAALLAAVVKGPALYSPRTHLAKAAARRQWVLDQMQEKGLASASAVAEAKAAPIVLAPEPDSAGELAPEVVDQVRKQMTTLLGPDWERQGYTVTTTLDPALQRAARAALRKAIDEHERRHGLLGAQLLPKPPKPPKTAKGKAPPKPPPPPKQPPVYAGPIDAAAYRKGLRGAVTAVDDAAGTITVSLGKESAVVKLADADRYNPKKLSPSQFTEVGKVVRVRLLGAPDDDGDVATQARGAGPLRARLELGPEGAMVALDPRTGDVLAWIGGYESARGGFDRASRAKRQPGSTMKTFVYAQGIASKKLTAATLLETSPEVLPPKYRPQNYDGAVGTVPVRLREALAQSVNVSAVWAAEKVGPKSVAKLAEGLGVKSPLGADLSLALGAYEVTPLELTTAYASLAAGGVEVAPRLVSRVVGADGTEVPLPVAPPQKRALDEASAYVTTSLLRSVIDAGTGKRAKVLARPIAGKTGTSNHAKDAWFVGYTPSFVCGVWIGYDDGEPLGAGESGGATALPGFIELAREALRGQKPIELPVPAGVVRVRIDGKTGLLAAEDQLDALDEVFLAGTEPTEVAVPELAPPVVDPLAVDPLLVGANDADAGAPQAAPSLLTP